MLRVVSVYVQKYSIIIKLDNKIFLTLETHVRLKCACVAEVLLIC